MRRDIQAAELIITSVEDPLADYFRTPAAG
jgi:hypothetical protein